MGTPKILKLLVFLIAMKKIKLGYGINIASKYAKGKQDNYLGSNAPSATLLSNRIHWTSLNSASELILKRPDPTGLEKGNPTYLCRAVFGNRYKPGKLLLTNGTILCSIADGGTENKLKSFQMLEAPPGATSWVPATTPGKVPKYAIIGGNHWNGNTAHVCRGSKGKDLLVGNYGNLNCYVSQDGGEHTIQNDLEFLVVNKYGIGA